MLSNLGNNNIKHESENTIVYITTYKNSIVKDA